MIRNQLFALKARNVTKKKYLSVSILRLTIYRSRKDFGRLAN
jgi:hypothetical protein